MEKKRTWLKRSLALLISAAVAVTAVPAIPAAAEETYTQVEAYDLEQTKEEILDSDEAKQYENGAVTFQGTATAVPVGYELVYHLFRQGNTEKEQTVTMVTQDLTAGYGEDYELIVDGKVQKGTAKRLLDGSTSTYDVYLDGSGSASSGSEEESRAADLEVDLDQVKENASCSFALTFAPKEQVKEIRIRAMLPEEAVGNKEFQLLVADCDGELEKGANPIVVVTVQETRETAAAAVSLVEGSEEVVDGYVTVLVERTGNTSGYTSYNMTAEDGSAVNGEDFVLKSTQLLFTPGVSRQRVHIPLVASETEETKTFTLRTDDSKSEVTYTSTNDGKPKDSFTATRGLIDIPMTEFTVGDATNAVDGVTFKWESDEERYKFGFRSVIGGGTERNASIKTKDAYDFTGVQAVRFSASYGVGTILGDHLNVYASNEDYAKQEAKLGQNIGGRYTVYDLEGQHMLEFSVDQVGSYHLYMTAEQHSGTGWIYYYLYNQEFNANSAKEGHVALVMKPYKIEVVPAGSVGGAQPAVDAKLTLSSDNSISGNKLSGIYRDDTFQLSYNLLNESAEFVGYELVDTEGVAYATLKQTDPTFKFSSDIISKYSSKFKDGDTLRIRPLFKAKQAVVNVLEQDFSGTGAKNLNADVDAENRTVTFTDNGTTVATVTWNTNQFNMGDSLLLEVKENPDYTGNYHFAAIEEVSANDETSVRSNPIYHADKDWKLDIDKAYYEITPMISNRQSRFLLNVKGATHGIVDGEPEDSTEDEIVIEDYDGHYDANDIAIMIAKPDDGYRAKWSYTDVYSGETKVYYGSIFYYQVQVAMLSTDNYVYLEFEKCDEKKKYSVIADVSMQGGNLLHEPKLDDVDYSPLSGAQVSLEGKAKETGDDGCTDVFELNALPGETYTALVIANNRQYVEDVVIPTEETTSVRQVMELSYYYEGPRVSNLRYYDYDGAAKNGDTIFLTEEKPSVIIAAEVEKAGKEITDVIFRLRDKNGSLKAEEAVAERYGTEYIWSENLLYKAAEGDQIWIELAYKEYGNGKDESPTKYISYGEVNTGYNIMIAQYNDIQYIPDTGVEDEYDCPIFGSVSPLLGTVAKPTFTVSQSGGITYLTIGIAVGTVFDGKDGSYGLNNTWGKYEKNIKKSMQALAKGFSKDTRYQARQDLKKENITLLLNVSAQLAFYDFVNNDTKQKQTVCVGAWVSFGINGTFTYNYPLFLEFVPCFVCLTITGGAADSFEVYARSDDGYVPIQDMHDPTKSSYKSENDFNYALSIGACFGIGVNGLVDVAAGGTGKMSLDFVDWSWGTGKLSFQGDLKMDLLIFGGTASFNIASFTMFDTNPYKESSELEAVQEAAEESLMNSKLSDFTMKPLNNYQQTVYMGSQGAVRSTGELSQTLISGAYEFSKPKMYPMGGDKYLVLATIDSRYVCENVQDTDAAQSVLVSAVYDAKNNEFVTRENGKIFLSLEPEGQIGKSVNFHPSVTAIGNTGKYLVTWNSILTDGTDTDKLNLTNARTVVRAAVYDSTKGEVTAYKSMTSEDDEERLMSTVVVDTAYDEANQEVVVLYRVMNLNGLKEDSTLADYSNAGNSLMCTSIKLDENQETTFTEGVEIASGGKQDGTAKIIKTADLDAMSGVPVIAYQMTEGSQANIISTAEDGSENHIYVTKLAHQNGGGYTVDTETDVTDKRSKKYDDSEYDFTYELSEEYNASPQLLSYNDGEKEKNILMWKTESGISTINPITLEETEIASISKDIAGVLDDYQIIEGQDGNIYSIWTEGNEDGTGTKVMMSALETFTYTDDNGETREKLSWGSGSEVFSTSDKEYVRAISPVVDSTGMLHALYRKSRITGEDDSNNGYSEVVMQHKDLTKNTLTVENYSQLTDEELEEFEGIPNLELNISNRYPQAGETVTITGRVKNAGVQASERQQLTLLADDADTGKTVTIPEIASGGEEEFTFTYTFPDDYQGTPVEFSVQGVNGSVASESTVNGANLEFLSASYEQLNYADDASSVSYDITLYIRNTGNDLSDPATFVLSHLEKGKDENGEDTVFDTVFGSCDIPAVKPGEKEKVVFRVENIPIEYFQDNIFGLASIGGAIYENYADEENRNIIATYSDYIQAEEAPVAENVTMAIRKTVGVGQSLRLKAAVYPTTAQKYAEFTYVSSDPGIATVDENGIITGVKEGTCTVTATTKNGIKKTVTIKVTKEAASEDDEEYENGGDSGNLPNGGGNGGDWSDGVDLTDETNSAATGDTTNPAIWIALILISAAAVVAILVIRKKKNK